MAREKNPVQKEMYRDLLQPAVRELGDILKSSVKVARFAFAGIDYLAAQQSRWQHFLEKVASKVEPANFTNAHPQIVGPVLENMMYVESGSMTEEMFANLLARAVDSTSQDLAHPAFPHIIQQLSHDEAVVLFYLKKRRYALRRQWDLQGSRTANMRTVIEEFPVKLLAYGDKLWMYMDHLYSLTVAGTWKTQNDEPVKDTIGMQIGGITWEERRLTDFGILFANACVPDEFPGLPE